MVEKGCVAHFKQVRVARSNKADVRQTAFQFTSVTAACIIAMAATFALEAVATSVLIIIVAMDVDPAKATAKETRALSVRGTSGDYLTTTPTDQRNGKVPILLDLNHVQHLQVCLRLCIHHPFRIFRLCCHLYLLVVSQRLPLIHCTALMSMVSLAPPVLPVPCLAIRLAGHLLLMRRGWLPANYRLTACQLSSLTACHRQRA